MSQPIRWSVSVDKETNERRDRLHARIFSLIRKNKSMLVQLVFEWAEFSGFTPQTVVAMMNARQGITGAIAEESVTPFNNSSQQFPVHAAPEGRTKPLTRITSASQQQTQGRGARGREVRSVSQFRAVGEAKGMGYRPLSFPARVRLSFASNFSTGRVA